MTILSNSAQVILGLNSSCVWLLTSWICCAHYFHICLYSLIFLIIHFQSSLCSSIYSIHFNPLHFLPISSISFQKKTINVQMVLRKFFRVINELVTPHPQSFFFSRSSFSLSKQDFLFTVFSLRRHRKRMLAE